MKSIKIKLFLLVCISFAQFVFSNHAFAIQEKTNYKNKTNPEIVKHISFDNILDVAKEHSYDLKIADYNILISKQGVRSARSEYFPKLNLGAGTEYNRNFRDVRDTTFMSVGDSFINPYTRFQSILGITVSYNVFDFGVRGGNMKIAKEDVSLKELESMQKYQELNLTLLDSYTKALVALKQISINQEILALEQNNLDLKTRLYEAKAISKMDLDDEKVKVHKIKTQISELKEILAESLNWLSFYTGQNYDANNIIIDKINKEDFNYLDFNDYSKTILWKIHEKNIKKKELELKVAKCNYLPKINVYGKYYLYGSDYSNYGKSLGTTPSNFAVGASLNMPVFDGFKNSALVQKTMIELKQLYITRDKAIAEYATKLANMRANLYYLEEQINENNKEIKDLTDKEKSTKRLLAKKLISATDDNDAKISLLQQRIEYEKNSNTRLAIIRGIQILTKEY